MTYTIQRNPDSRQFNVHVDHLKQYVGENGPQPWVGTEENGDIDFNQSEAVLPSGNARNSDELSVFSPLEDENVLEYEEMSYPPLESTSPVRSPVRTRVGRAVKPRDIYSP